MKRCLLPFALFWIGTTCANAADTLETVIWSRAPTAEEFEALYPRRTEDDFSGQIETECHIRDREGHLNCEVPAVEPEYDDIAQFAKTLAEQYFQVDMEKTQGAAVGKRVKVKLRITGSD